MDNKLITPTNTAQVFVCILARKGYKMTTYLKNQIIQNWNFRKDKVSIQLLFIPYLYCNTWLRHTCLWRLLSLLTLIYRQKLPSQMVEVYRKYHLLSTPQKRNLLKSRMQDNRLNLFFFLSYLFVPKFLDF